MTTPEEFERKRKEQQQREREQSSGAWKAKAESKFSPSLRWSYRARKEAAEKEKAAREDALRTMRSPRYSRIAHGTENKTTTARKQKRESLLKRISAAMRGHKALAHVPPKVPLSDDDYDVLVIGGGFSGAYCAYELNKANSGLKIGILEKDSDVGGRLFSDDNDHNSHNKDELGGMRIFPSVQPHVAQVVQEVGCELVPVKLADEDNIFFYEGERHRKGDFRLSDCGLRPKEMIADCIANYREAMPKDSKLSPYESKELRNLSLPAFLEKYGASRGDIQEYFSFSGYDIFSDDHVAASVFVQEGQLYGADLDEDQHYVREGFEEVVHRLAKNSGAEIRLETRVTGVDEVDPDGFCPVTCRHDGETLTLRARRVIIGLPQDAAARLAKRCPILQGERLDLMRNAVKIIPLFKVFLEFEKPEDADMWWRESGFQQGKSSTDLEVRQVHYYDHEDILCYCSGRYAEYWDREFRANWRAAAREVFHQMQLMHGETSGKLPEPMWDSTIFHFWNNGSHKWCKGVNVSAAMHTICHGGQADSKISATPILVVGDAYSSQQGWVAGALETSEIALRHLKAALA